MTFLICQGFSSSIDIDELDTRYLQKTGGSISSNLIINGSLDVKTNITLPDIGDVEDTIQGKQDTIQDGDLTIAKTSGLQTALNGKQPTIEDGDLNIAKTPGLQSALDSKFDDTGGPITGNVDISGILLVGTADIIDELGTKQPTIQDGDLTIAKTNGLQSALNAKQPTIEDGDLTIAKTDGLQTALEAKQDTISNFEINGNVNLNTSGTNFDTIVVRRPTNATGITDDYLIDLNELQIWVNNANILIENASSLISSVVSWSNKDLDLGSQKSPTNLYNGVIAGDNGVLTLDPSPTDIAIIIKNIPTT